MRQVSGVATIVVLLLAGCVAPAEVERSPDYRAPLARSGLEFAAAHGPVLTVIRGNPFDQEEAERDRVVLGAAQRALAGLGIRLTTDPAEAPRPDFRLVLLLDPEGDPSAAEICRDPDAVAVAPLRRELHVQAAFCEGERPLGSATGHSEVDDAEDLRFLRVVRETTETLFPGARRAYVDRYFYDPPHRFLWSFGLGVRL